MIKVNSVQNGMCDFIGVQQLQLWGTDEGDLLIRRGAAQMYFLPKIDEKKYYEIHEADLREFFELSKEEILSPAIHPIAKFLEDTVLIDRLIPNELFTEEYAAEAGFVYEKYDVIQKYIIYSKELNNASMMKHYLLTEHKGEMVANFNLSIIKDGTVSVPIIEGYLNNHLLEIKDSAANIVKAE